MWRAMLLAAALALAACGGHAGEDETPGLDLESRSTQPWMLSADVQPRVQRVIQAEAARFDLDPGALSGVRITVVDDEDVDCPGMHGAGGCAVGKSIKVSTFGARCVEQVPFAHELLHVWIGDPHHKDPRWQELPSLMIGDGC